MTTSRRSLLQAGAWTAPVIAVAVAAPQASASAVLTTLVQTHFDVHAENIKGSLRVKFGYQGAQQGEGYSDMPTFWVVLVDGKQQASGSATLVKSGYSGHIDVVAPVAATGDHTVSYQVRNASGTLLLSDSTHFTSPDWWKWQ